MMSEALKMLDESEDIDVINIVSKPPARSVQQKIIDHAASMERKKDVMTFIGGSTANSENTKVKEAGSDLEQYHETKQIIIANTLTSRSLQRQTKSLTQTSPSRQSILFTSRLRISNG